MRIFSRLFQTPAQKIAASSVALHPLDQFRAFQALRAMDLGDEEIAARFFVTPTVVKQRLRLAAVSDKLLEIYAEINKCAQAGGQIPWF